MVKELEKLKEQLENVANTGISYGSMGIETTIHINKNKVFYDIAKELNLTIYKSYNQDYDMVLVRANYGRITLVITEEKEDK